MCCIGFSLQHLFFVLEASLLVEDDADLRDAVPLPQHVQPPGVAERGFDFAQEEICGHGVAADALDGDAKLGPAIRPRSAGRFVGLQFLTRGPAPLCFVKLK